MRPIYELETRRFLQTDADDTPAIWQKLDLMWIAFAVLDTISELSEYQLGATRDEVLEKILPIIRRQTTAFGLTLTGDGLYKVLGKVFDHLVNRDNRYLPFDYTYFDGTTNRHHSRKFWLIKTIYTGQGKKALFSLTEEGYTAYFGLHETSALDATAIGNLRIKLLIERGNVDDAISVAEGNRKQCIRKALEIRNIRRLIKRNIRTVDFEQVKTLAEEGIHQGTDIQKESARLHNMVIENLPVSAGEKHGRRLYHLADLLEGVNHQLMKLSSELQHLPEDFHNHSHKLFRRRSSGAFPPMDQVMRRVLSMAENDAANVGTEFIARIDPPGQRPIFDPAAVIEACDRALERKNGADDRRQTVVEVDGASIERFVPDLDETIMEQAFVMLHDTVKKKGEIRLSRLLEKSMIGEAVAEFGVIFPVAVAMAVFQCVVDPRIARFCQIQVKMLDTESRIERLLPAGRKYRGHELYLKFKPIFQV
ncbi:MAG: hypothetical protein ACQERN_12170 [Thermodesulfobacteriota bacterium]